MQKGFRYSPSKGLGVALPLEADGRAAWAMNQNPLKRFTATRSDGALPTFLRNWCRLWSPTRKRWMTASEKCPVRAWGCVHVVDGCTSDPAGRKTRLVWGSLLSCGVQAEQTLVPSGPCLQPGARCAPCRRSLRARHEFCGVAPLTSWFQRLEH